MSAALAELGISPREYCVLAKAIPGLLTQGELAALSLQDKTTMVVTLDGLEGAGLARRRPSSSYRRARIVETTEAGVALVERARTVIADLYSEVLGVLTDQERTAFLDALVRLVGAEGPRATAVPLGNAAHQRAHSSR